MIYVAVKALTKMKFQHTPGKYLVETDRFTVNLTELDATLQKHWLQKLISSLFLEGYYKTRLS